MKKLFVLGGLIAASAMQAQPVGKTIYYWPNERVTEITSGTQYFIYNAAYDLGSTPNDRGSFLYANGNSNFGTLNPKQLQMHSQHPMRPICSRFTKREHKNKTSN